MVTMCPTHQDCVECFIEGMQKRMGDIMHPDHTLSITIMLELMQLVENDWIAAQTSKKTQISSGRNFLHIGIHFRLAGRINFSN